MLKISHDKIVVGTEFSIRNKWRTRIAQLLDKNEETYPFLFRVVNVDTHMCLCESIPDKLSKKKYWLSISTMVIRYLRGQEVPDCHCGLYFHDYLPLENEQLLLTDVRRDVIIPTRFQLNIGINTQDVVVNDGVSVGKIPYIDFELFNLMTSERLSLTAHVKHSWKLLNGPETYMNAMEQMYRDTFVHKEYVITVCRRFAEWLHQNALHEDAEELLARAAVHDNSKIRNKDEFRALTSLIADRSCMGDAKAQLSIFKQDSLELHWKHNSHHPEHFEKYEDMSRLDRMEMVCDWMARALQYGTSLMEFVETRQTERFHFPESMYEEIHHYCKVLVALFE